MPPTRYEMEDSYLKKEVEKTKTYLKKYQEDWKFIGCSIMTDAWSDRQRRSIMNLGVNSKLGTIFLSSKECSDQAHTSENIFEYVDKCIEEVGPENAVKVVTDNASNNMGASKLLKEKRPTVF
ncbi:putative ribonuclease H-like superfamily [Helianthus annuus]|nr:putative ribonuclease H-like superfamily [Helianthus annuus]